MSPAGRVKPDRARPAWLLGVLVGCALIGVGLVALKGSVLPFDGWPSPDRPGVGESALAQQQPDEASTPSQGGSGVVGDGGFPSALPLPAGAGADSGVVLEPAGAPDNPLQSTGPTSDTVSEPSGPGNGGTPGAPVPPADVPLPVDDGSSEIPIPVVDLGPGASGSVEPGRDPRLSRGKAQEGDDAPPVDERPAPSTADNPPPAEGSPPAETPATVVPDVTTPQPSEPPVAVPAQPSEPPVAAPTQPDPSNEPGEPQGETPPADGETPPADGETPPAEGETPPGTDEQPPGGGETPPAEHEPPPSDDDGGDHHHDEEHHESDCD